MKRKVIAAIIGTVGVVSLATSSYGQGSIFFNNYESTPYWPIVYGAGTGALQGTGAGANVDAELGYFIGTSSNPAVFTLLASTITAVNPASIAPPNGSGAPTTGYFEGPIASIPGYTSGPISFEILAWVASGVGSGAGGTFATSTINDGSAPMIWTEPSIPANPSPATFFTALSGETILTSAVPEPSTLALAGLGGLASLVALRRKKA
jgi:PEP-CTERM motif